MNDLSVLEPSAAGPPPGAEGSVSIRSTQTFREALMSARALPIAVATMLLFLVSPAVASGSLSESSLLSTLPFAAILAVAAIGQTLVVQQGGFDLSVAGAISLSAAIVTQVPNGQDDRLLMALAVAVGVITLAGTVVGLCIRYLDVSPIVATLALNALFLGAVQQLTQGSPQNAPQSLTSFALGRTLGVPNTALVAVVVVAGVAFVGSRTIAGRRFNAVGSSARAARIAGIRQDRYLVATYALAAFTYAVAGLLVAGFLKTPNLYVGNPYLLTTVAAVVIGGTALTGGTGTVVGTAVGALFLCQLEALLFASGSGTAIRYVIEGAIVALGVGLRLLPWRQVVKLLPAPSERRAKEGDTE
ncbi:ABC transporter permease [Nocardioides cavernae]|uniref:ABC transporter permease n=1 Tax=Nocardioides cavernae TaxID=1921566 RepID=A0ABR8NAK5_9ACTN|nr:ABC transporter permease [Nocardioides cavernae]MBD3924210.1 ABC transporter permease [Nocardioides cavernae]MBM7510852.1 ribose transport system permease protein [Nocardioides cavernae]